MAKDKTVSARASDIAAKLHQACGAIAQNTRDIAERQEEIQGLSGQLNGIGGTRLSVAHEVAALASSEAWTNGEIVQACALAGKMGNNNDSTSKTVNVFISEMKVFAHPKVRDMFPTISQACQDAWTAEQEYLAGLEGEERKGADTPVRKFKSRIYHLTIEIARRVKDDKLGGNLTSEDVVAYCRANDPDQDENKVAKQLATAIAGLDEIFTNFGLEEIKVATDYLRTVTAKELLAARTAMLAQVEDMIDGIEAETGTGAGTQVPAPAAPAAPAAPSTTMAAGASDVLDDLMNDPSTGLLLAA